tara:strand:- start:529 stop:975 length:447 start_codon:yes stop_codon:yes gene_type:complete
MTPLDQIRKGILEGDMVTVALGYKSLTGEDLRDTEESAAEQIETDTPPSSPILSSTSDDFIAPSKKKDSKSSGNRMARSSPIPTESRENLFVDNGKEHKDISTPEIELSPRQRNKFIMIEQECQKCEKTFEVHPIHKREHYICDRCIK